MLLDKISLVLTIIGALNWGAIGLFRFDVVAWIFGGQDAVMSRIIYTVVALAGVWCISLLFRERTTVTDDEVKSHLTETLADSGYSTIEEYMKASDLEQVREDLLVDKVMDFLVANNHVEAEAE